MSDGRRDVELRCNTCGNETLATDGCWAKHCWKCGGIREVVHAHDHVLTWKEAKDLGYDIVPIGNPAPPRDP